MSIPLDSTLYDYKVCLKYGWYESAARLMVNLIDVMIGHDPPMCELVEEFIWWNGIGRRTR